MEEVTVYCWECNEKIAIVNKSDLQFWEATSVCPKCREAAQTKDLKEITEMNRKEMLDKCDEVVALMNELKKLMRG
jgi:phage FluMu protein Com